MGSLGSGPLPSGYIMSRYIGSEGGYIGSRGVHAVSGGGESCKFYTISDTGNGLLFLSIYIHLYIYIYMYIYIITYKC